MTMWTEARIKEKLDGNFWFFDQEGKQHHQFVDPTWMPKHKKSNNPYAIVIKKDPGVKWSRESYDLILEMRGDGMSWPMIGDIFQVPVSTLTDYTKKMQRIRAMQAERDANKIKVDEVRRMIAAGYDLERIRKETGYDRRLIKDVFEEE